MGGEADLSADVNGTWYLSYLALVAVVVVHSAAVAVEVQTRVDCEDFVTGLAGDDVRDVVAGAANVADVVGRGLGNAGAGGEPVLLDVPAALVAGDDGAGMAPNHLLLRHYSSRWYFHCPQLQYCRHGEPP